MGLGLYQNDNCPIWIENMNNSKKILNIYFLLSFLRHLVINKETTSPTTFNSSNSQIHQLFYPPLSLSYS